MLFWIALVLCLGLQAQTFLLVENRNSLKNFKYYAGDDIRFRSCLEDRIIEGPITMLSDSSMIIGEIGEVNYNEIEIIYRQRLPIRWAQGLLFLGGAAYFSIDSFNRLINNQSPVILAETAYISAGMIAASAVLIPLRYKKVKKEKWEFRVIDFSELGRNP
jgi:hypothetical protein